MNKRYVTWYIENGIIKMDFFGLVGWQSRKEAEEYLFWCS